MAQTLQPRSADSQMKEKKAESFGATKVTARRASMKTPTRMHTNRACTQLITKIQKTVNKFHLKIYY